MEALIREIGDRGVIKAKVSEGVPPRAPAPAPAPAPAAVFEPTSEPAPALALAPAVTPDRGFSPSMQQLKPTSVPMMQCQAMSGGDGGSSFSEMALFFKEQREEAKAERAAMEARLDAKDVKMEEQRKEMEERLSAPPPAAIGEEQLAAFQVRIECLHAAKMLADEELCALEDLIANYVELTMSVPGRVITRDVIYALPDTDAAVKLDQLTGLSAAMAVQPSHGRCGASSCSVYHEKSARMPMSMYLSRKGGRFTAWKKSPPWSPGRNRPSACTVAALRSRKSCTFSPRRAPHAA